MVRQYLERTEGYLRENLIPFWEVRAVDPVFGGFQTNYDRHGQRTAVTEKTLLCQGRSLFTIAHAVRLGYAWKGWKSALRQGMRFLRNHFRDRENDGYYWIVEEDGRVKDPRKVMYGHSFLIYAFAEVALVSGDRACAREACRLFDLVLARAADLRHGGFFEHFDRRFNPETARTDGLLHKSLDVHMHLMEAFTTLYELTGQCRHRQALAQVTDLIFERMVNHEMGVGVSMFAADWSPLSNRMLGTVWGSDRFADAGKPPAVTSYGHNIELAWLYLHSLEVLGLPKTSGLARVRPLFLHTWERGIDWECGGLYVEGDRHGVATETNKEFWQQAEALVGFLDAWLLTGEQKYFDAFRNVHDFVFTKMINWTQGEWFPLLRRDGGVLWDYMGHNWKIFYHTVRSMGEVARRLRLALDAGL